MKPEEVNISKAHLNQKKKIAGSVFFLLNFLYFDGVFHWDPLSKETGKWQMPAAA